MVSSSHFPVYPNFSLRDLKSANMKASVEKNFRVPRENELELLGRILETWSPVDH